MNVPVFYATYDSSTIRSYMQPVPTLLSAASFEALGRKRGHPGTLPVAKLPSQVSEVAIDPGGFMAQMKYGGYRFTWGAYIEWLFSFGDRLSWAAFPDLPCESELASDAYEVRRRQEQTLEYAHEFWGTAFQGDSTEIDDTEGFDFRSQFPWTWVATIQGRNVEEYVWHAEQLAPLLHFQDADYWGYAANPPIFGDVDDADENLQRGATRAIKGALTSRVAIGSLCRRESANEVVAIVEACHQVLPNQTFHLWGVKLGALGALRDAGLLPWVRSMDSSAWNGRHPGRIDAFDAARAELDMSQREYAIKEKLPEYLGKVDAALTAPHTPRMI